MARLLLATAMLLATATPIRAQDSGEDPATEDQEIVVVPTARVRLTFYVEAGRTYSGQQTYMGSTACSWNYPLGTRFRFRDGETVTCVDRGLLGNSGWLDLWRQPELVAKYGPYADVMVVDP